MNLVRHLETFPQDSLAEVLDAWQWHREKVRRSTKAAIVVMGTLSRDGLQPSITSVVIFSIFL